MFWWFELPTLVNTDLFLYAQRNKHTNKFVLSETKESMYGTKKIIETNTRDMFDHDMTPEMQNFLKVTFILKKKYNKSFDVLMCKNKQKTTKEIAFHQQSQRTLSVLTACNKATDVTVWGGESRRNGEMYVSNFVFKQKNKLESFVFIPRQHKGILDFFFVCFVFTQIRNCWGV